ncbi:MAG: polyprenyl synthetase family protein [Alphaproteobacteria bacterium]
MATSAAPLEKPAPADMAALRGLVRDDLARVNDVIAEQVKSEISLISDVATHLIAAGGKRLRPSLTLAAATLCGYTGERHVRLAASVEFIHTATLLHDDVVDESALRRGEATANAVWGNKASVLVGDFLLSRAFQLMVADGSLDVLKILSDAAATISAAEVEQLMASHDLAISQATYEKIIGGKTATLFAAACELGAVVSGKLQWREALHRYGYALGMAFQMVDDALDYAAEQSELGKNLGDDFRDGKVTMPVLVAYQKADAEEREFWQRTLESQSFAPEDLATAKRLLARHRAFEATLARAETFARDAAAAIADFPESAAKAALLEAAAFTVQRGY